MFHARFRGFLFLVLFLLGQLSVLAHEFQHDSNSGNNICVSCINSLSDDNTINSIVYFAPVEVLKSIQFNIEVCPISLRFYTQSKPRAPPTIS